MSQTASEFYDERSLALKAGFLRGRLEPHFSPDTAAPGTQSQIPSAGHCAVVAFLFWRQMGGTLVSAKLGGSSHWFNRVLVREYAWDLDLTGDQFGCSPMRMVSAGSLYAGTYVRRLEELNEETLSRASVLAERARLELPSWWW